MQTMHFIRGSEHRRHQDQYYLPDCFSAWIPLEDVSQKNGTIFVEPGSHEGDLFQNRTFLGQWAWIERFSRSQSIFLL